MSLPRLIILLGPTASGKTGAALELSRKIPAEAISFDSMQVYRKMLITTQAPTRAVMSKLKTHLVSFLDPDEVYSASLFREDAAALIPKILKKNKTPLLVGGTGLYIRALLDGLFESDGKGPFSDEKLRRRLEAEQARHGGSWLHDRLKEVDEISAKRIHPNDLRRTIRALEVHKLTGKPMSGLMPNRKGVRELYDCRVFYLDCVREDLYARVNHRVDKMVRQGLVNEVKKLLKIKLSKTAETALGIREVKAYLEGRTSLEEAKELLKKNTRNYAKRQLSWFRYEKHVENIPVVAGETAKDIAKKILSRLA